MTHRRPLAALVPLLALAVAACGTTLDDKDFTLQSGRGTAVSSDGQAVPGGDGSGESSGTTADDLADGAAAGGTTSTSDGPGSSSSTGSSSTTTTGTTAGPTSVPQKPLPTKVDEALAPVEIGIYYPSDANSTAAGAGSNVDFGDPKAQTTAILDYINAHGGIAGHKAVPVYEVIALSNTSSYSTLEQQTCDDWTQDHHVIAGIVIGNVPSLIQKCMNDRKAVIFGTTFYMHDKVDYANWPFMYFPADVVSDDQDTALVESLVRRGFFKPGDKVGVFYEDFPGSQRAYDNALVPALKKHGITITDQFAGHFPESNAELANAAASLQTPTLKFKTEGINKVIFAGTAESATVMQYAESNGYHPNYAFTTNENPQDRENNKTAHTQLPGALGVGWNPTVDILTNPPAENAAGLRCLDIMKPISGANSPAAKYAAFHFCSHLFAIAEGAAQNPQTTYTGDALRIGLNRLGSNYLNPYSISNLLTANHRAGAGTARDMAYDTGCFCWQYTSEPYRLP